MSTWSVGVSRASLKLCCVAVDSPLDEDNDSLGLKPKLMRGVLRVGGFRVTVEAEFIIDGNNKASLGMVLSAIQLEDKPLVVNEFDQCVPIIDCDPISGGVGAIVALVPCGRSLDMGRGVVGGSGYEGGKNFSFRDAKV